jgi:hypothetical protein
MTRYPVACLKGEKFGPALGVLTAKYIDDVSIIENAEEVLLKKYRVLDTVATEGSSLD